MTTFAQPHSPASQMTQYISGLKDIADRYDVILCDVWGVVHNGVSAWAAASGALANFRAKGGTVVLITNAPRPNGPVVGQLASLGVPDKAFDQVVTSGDVTRKLIAEYPPQLYHLGPKRDRTLFDGLNTDFVPLKDAKSVVCTGMFDDTSEQPEDYADMLAETKALGLDFICANPDIVVERGNQLIWCAGALARDYAAIGGKTMILGKPHAPIYDHALAVAADISGSVIDRSRVLAIGDGMPTDVKGAQDYGLALLYISAGIHAADYGDADAPDRARLETFLAEHKASPTATMPRLKW